MGIFNRKNKTDDLVERLVAEVVKAQNSMSATPLANSGYSTATAAQPAQMSGVGGQGLIQTPGAQANPLPRPGSSFGSQLGPAAPFLPAPLDPVFDDSGRALPRIWEYPVAWNLDLNQRATPWTVLRSMADQIDIIHRAIEIKIAEITKMGWSFEIEDATITAIMAEQNCSHAKASRIARQDYSDKIAALREFWENPYPQLGRTFTEWMTEFLWQHFVFDGTPVYPRYNLGREVVGFEIIDAPTIKVLLDNRGAIPEPPAPAFQQVLWGFPRGEYQFTPNSDGEFFVNAGKNNEFLRDQLAYFVRNRRTWSPYGFSAVEESVPAATLYLERQQWMKSEYRDGATPLAFFETDSEEMDPTHLAAFERVFNDRLMGSTTERHRMKVLPRGFKPVFAPTVDERYKNEYDEFLIMRVATVFGVAPSALGIVPRSGLGGSGERKGEAQAALTTSQKPLESFLVETINTLSRRFLGADKNLTFAFDDDQGDVAQLAAKAQAFQVSLASGQMTVNDVRGELNMPLYEIPEADEPFIMAGNTIQFLTGLLEQDESGEVVGMKGQENGEQLGGAGSGDSVPQKGQGGKESQGSQEGVAEVKPSQNPVKAPPTAETAQKSQVVSEPNQVAMLTEARDFAKFVKARHKTGKWRAFEFEAIPEDVRDILNERGYFIAKGVATMPESLTEWAVSEVERALGDTPKGRLATKASLADLPGIQHKLAIEKHYAPVIDKALSESVTGINSAISAALTAAGSKAAGSGIDVTIRQELKFNATPLVNALRGVYSDASYIGTAYAVRDLGDGASLSYEMAKAAAGIDWSSWEPGSPEAAALLDNGALDSRLAQLGITIQGLPDLADAIGQTTLDRVGNAISDGVAAGLPSRTIASNITPLVQNPARAMVIATTETNRAYNQAATDQYAAAGISQYEWVAFDDESTCRECSDNAGPHDIGGDLAPPPAHPNCRCTVDAVISTQAATQ